MRIAQVVWSLHPGGGERVVANLANRWAAAGHETAIVTFRDPSTDFYELDPRVVRLSAVERSRVPTLGIGRLERLRQPGGLRAALRDYAPDVVVSAINITNIQALVATRRLGGRAGGRVGIPVIVCEHIHPTEEHIGRFWDLLRRRTYLWADAVVMLTEAGAGWARGFLPPERVKVIPNFVDVPPGAPDHHGGTRRFLAVGRMRAQKGFDVLLRAFARTRAVEEGWTLRIVGDGPEREHVLSVHSSLGLGEAVSFPGRTKAIWDEYASADAYVLSSRFEGFPMVLLEAMAVGMPLVATDCPTGPAELITDGVDGLLVPPEDPEALAAAMDRLATDPGLRRRLGESARGVRERFGAERVLGLWEELLGGLGGRDSPS